METAFQPEFDGPEADVRLDTVTANRLDAERSSDHSPAGGVLTLDRGGRLALRRAQDQLWRARRSESVQRGLRLASRLGQAGRTAAVMAGIAYHLSWWWLFFSIPHAFNEELHPGWLGILISGGIALPLCALLVHGCALLERWLRRYAQARWIELEPESKAVTPGPARAAPPAMGAPFDGLQQRLLDLRARRLQERLNGCYVQEIGGRSFCLGVGNCVLAFWVMKSVVWSLSGLAGGIVDEVVIKWVLPFSVLPAICLAATFPLGTLSVVIGWLRRKALLRKAARLQFQVSDPARRAEP